MPTDYKKLIADCSHKLNGNIQYFLLAKKPAEKEVYAKQVKHFAMLKKRYATARANQDLKHQLKLSI